MLILDAHGLNVASLSSAKQCSQFLQCLTGYAYIHTFAVGITNWTQKFTTARSDLVPVFWPQSWLSDI